MSLLLRRLREGATRSFAKVLAYAREGSARLRLAGRFGLRPEMDWRSDGNERNASRFAERSEVHSASASADATLRGAQRRTFAIFILVSSVAAFAPARAQDILPTPTVSVGGSAELFTEMYRVNGRDARRPSETARLDIRPHVTFGNAFSLGANLLLSTEGSGFGAAGRQRVNRFGLNPTWSWGSAHVGDFSDAISSLTYEGIPVRGGALSVEPGLLRLAALGGVTQRAVAGDASNGSFGRRLYAGRLGIGKEDGSYFDVVALYADDDVGSLSPEEQFVDRDSIEVGTRVGSSSVTPQQNLVAGLNTQVTAFSRRLVWQGELAAAAYTRDKRAAQVAEEDVASIPTWLTDLFTPRIGSTVDLAWKTNVQLRLPAWNVTAGYNYIGPGYQSLGLGSMLVDREELLARATYAAGKVTANLAASTLHDNVLDQKAHTTRRNMLALTTNYRLRPTVMLTFRGASNTMKRDDENPDARIDYANRSFGSGARMTIRRARVRSAGIEYRLQRSSDANPARMADLTMHQLLAPIGLQFGRSISVTPHVGLVYLKHPVDGWQLTHTEKLAVRHTLDDRRLLTTLVAGTSFSDGSRRFAVTATSAYRFSSATSMKLSVQQNVFRGGASSVDGTGVNASEEYVVRLSLENRF